MKTYKVNKKLTKAAKRELNRIIETHRKLKNSFFWSPSGNSNTRDRSEKKFAEENPDVTFITSRGNLRVRMRYTESCKNVYYHCDIQLNGKKKTISAVKKLLNKKL